MCRVCPYLPSTSRHFGQGGAFPLPPGRSSALIREDSNRGRPHFVLSAAIGNKGVPEPLGETLLEFTDNRLLIDLCGPHDRNLAQIEQAFDVTITRHGNRLRLQGSEGARTEAAAALNGLYERLEQGRPVLPADIDRVARMGPEAMADAPRAVRGDGQLDLFPGGRVELHQSQGLVAPRTPDQRAHM